MYYENFLQETRKLGISFLDAYGIICKAEKAYTTDHQDLIWQQIAEFRYELPITRITPERTYSLKEMLWNTISSVSIGTFLSLLLHQIVK